MLLNCDLSNHKDCKREDSCNHNVNDQNVVHFEKEESKRRRIHVPDSKNVRNVHEEKKITLTTTTTSPSLTPFFLKSRKPKSSKMKSKDRYNRIADRR